MKASSIILRLARAFKEAEHLAPGAFKGGDGSQFVRAAANHLDEVLAITSDELVDMKTFGKIDLDYAIAPETDEDLPISILLSKSGQTVAIPIVWTARAITFSASSINPYPVIIPLGMSGAGTRLTTFVADVVTIFFAGDAIQSRAAMAAEFVEMQEVAQ